MCTHTPHHTTGQARFTKMLRAHFHSVATYQGLHLHPWSLCISPPTSATQARQNPPCAINRKTKDTHTKAKKTMIASKLLHNVYYAAHHNACSADSLNNTQSMQPNLCHKIGVLENSPHGRYRRLCQGCAAAQKLELPWPLHGSPGTPR